MRGKVYAILSSGIEMSWKVPILSLRVPSFDPGTRTEASIGRVELLAWCEIFTLGVYALVVVDIILPAVLGLVRVGESSVVARGHKLEWFGYSFLPVRHFLLTGPE